MINCKKENEWWTLGYSQSQHILYYSIHTQIDFNNESVLDFELIYRIVQNMHYTIEAII